MKKVDEDIELLEEIDDIIDILEMEELTEKDYDNLESLEQITNLCVFAFPILGTCYAFANFHSIHNFMSSTLALGAGVVANSFSKNAEVEYIPKSKYNQKLRALRKRFATVLMALNISTMTVSGFSILGNLTTSFNLNKTGGYNAFKVIEDFSPNKDTILESLEYSISNNALLVEKEREQIRRLYPYFQDNEYLDFLKVYRNLNTIDVFYLENQNLNIAADYDRENNEIHVYNGNSLERRVPHEIIHSTGSFNINFLNEGMTSIIVSEYCYTQGNIGNAYIPEVYLTSIIIELVGKDTMLEAYSKENTDLVIEKLLENSDTNTVHQLLKSFAELCIRYRNITETDEQSKQKFLTCHDETKDILVAYLNQKLPCNNPKNIFEQIATKARIYKFYNRFKLGLVEFIPKFYFNKNKHTIKSNAIATLTFEEAIDIIEEFEEISSKEINIKHLE